MQEHRANALLFSEETLNYFQFNFNPAITPEKCSHFAISYLLTILNMVLKSDKDKYK